MAAILFSICFYSLTVSFSVFSLILLVCTSTMLKTLCLCSIPSFSLMSHTSLICRCIPLKPPNIFKTPETYTRTSSSIFLSYPSSLSPLAYYCLTLFSSCITCPITTLNFARLYTCFDSSGTFSIAAIIPFLQCLTNKSSKD